MRSIVVAVDGLLPEQKARVDASAVDWATVSYVSEKPKSWDEALRNAEIVFGWPAPEALASSSILFHQLPSSGYDRYDIAALKQKLGFRLANSRGVVARAVAEHGLAFMFAFNRELPMHLGQRAGKVWQRGVHYRMLKGQTLCIIGLGAIGEELARLAKALDMRVLAVNRTRPSSTVAEQVWPLSQAHLALGQSDHVVMTIAASPDRPPFFSWKHFAAMQPGAHFYNLASGPVVEEAALIEALGAGRIAGAGLDTFANEPLPVSSPLWEMSNVLITPHAGGRFLEENEMLVDLFLENLQLYKQSQPLRNVVIGKEF